MRTILVTGIGGTRSIAVLKALRMSPEPYRVIGTDANYFNAGSVQCDASYIVPFASDPGYLPKLEEIIVKEKVEMVFATVEKEVKYLATQKAFLEKKHDVTIMVPDADILHKLFDKYQTQAFLKQNGFTSIPCIYAGDQQEVQKFVQEHGFPLIRKPVFGYGSKGLSILRDQAELDVLPLDNDYVLQQYIENADNESFYTLELNEYTAEIFVNADGSVAGGVVIKRALHSGETVAGYLVQDEKIVAYLSKIAVATGIRGPINFQFRMNSSGIFVFEINPLFSGTTAVRARFGFNGVQLAIESFRNGNHQTVKQTDLKPAYFLRYLEEICIEPQQLDELRDKKYTSRKS